MDLVTLEKGKLLNLIAALLAERRRARGLKPNHPEAVALITAPIMEGTRDGRTVAQLMSEGKTVLSRADVMEGRQAPDAAAARHDTARRDDQTAHARRTGRRGGVHRAPRVAAAGMIAAPRPPSPTGVWSACPWRE